MMKCSCCGADITAPQFHEGKAYGWTCILKVRPKAKRNKLVCVQANSFVITPNRRSAVVDGVSIAQGLRYPTLGADHPLNTSAWFISDNGVVQLEMRDFRNGRNVVVPIWKKISPSKYKEPA